MLYQLVIALDQIKMVNMNIYLVVKVFDPV